MKIRLALIVLCMLLPAVWAFAYTDAQCMNMCTASGNVPQYCSTSCSTELGPRSTIIDRQNIQELKNKRLEEQSRKIQLKQQSFECIAACKASGDESDEYCNQSCSAGTR